MTTLGLKRTNAVGELQDIQTANQSWWTQHRMSYDWNDKSGIERYSDAWFDEADRRFVFGARLFAHGDQPFDQIIPFHQSRGKRVLEIGCGMGLHSELMVRAGAQLTAIDISETNVMAARKRFALRGLTGAVQQMDAAELSFPDEHFDFVWSWGLYITQRRPLSSLSKFLAYCARAVKSG
jgi:2-polyprenyl-3-methyl-5-hydroxy-6-metoxy-1,4-benzoquinol methylase